VIEEVLTFSRLEAGREEVRPVRVDLGDLVRESAALIEPSLRGKDVSLRVDVPVEAVTVESDSGKIRQILLNLLSNAAKFTDRGEIEVVLRTDPSSVRIVVRDTGIGMPHDDLEKIFEPFTQLAPVTTRTRPGTGLGLSVSRHLARLLEGDLTVDSEPGIGSRFELWLPRHPASGRSAPQGRTAA
jgi:signal transduction histidine kinase